MSGARADRDLDALPALPRDADGPVFREPWQAQAFAMTLELHAAGCFTWKEWSAALAGEIAAAGAPDPGDRYYHHWLAALEKLVVRKSLLDAPALRRRRDAWARAARATPHGEPIALERAAAGLAEGEDHHRGTETQSKD